MFGVQSRMASEELPNLTPPMCVQTIPQQDKRAPHMAQQVAKERNHFGLANGCVRMKSHVPAQPAHLRRNGDCPDHRQMPMVSGPRPQHRCLAARCPGATNQGHEKNACFIKKNQRSASSRGFFLIRGQSATIHCRIPVSSRSRARGSGFWEVNPSDLMPCPIFPAPASRLPLDLRRDCVSTISGQESLTAGIRP